MDTLSSDELYCVAEQCDYFTLDALFRINRKWVRLRSKSLFRTLFKVKRMEWLLGIQQEIRRSIRLRLPMSRVQLNPDHYLDLFAYQVLEQNVRLMVDEFIIVKSVIGPESELHLKVSQKYLDLSEISSLLLKALKLGYRDIRIVSPFH